MNYFLSHVYFHEKTAKIKLYTKRHQGTRHPYLYISLHKYKKRIRFQCSNQKGHAVHFKKQMFKSRKSQNTEKNKKSKIFQEVKFHKLLYHLF